MKSTLGPFTLVAAALFIVPAIARAQTAEGAFINGNIGRASIDRGAVEGDDASFGVNTGYRWAVSSSAMIGFEVGYVDLGQYSSATTIFITPISPIGGPPAETQAYPVKVINKSSGWTIGANGRFNLSPNWYIGGRAGYIRASVDSRVRAPGLDDSLVPDQSEFNAGGWYAGAGFGYDFSNNLSLGLNYDYYSAKKHGAKFDPDAISLSGEFRF